MRQENIEPMIGRELSKTIDGEGRGALFYGWARKGRGGGGPPYSERTCRSIWSWGTALPVFVVCGLDFYRVRNAAPELPLVESVYRHY